MRLIPLAIMALSISCASLPFMKDEVPPVREIHVPEAARTTIREPLPHDLNEIKPINLSRGSLEGNWKDPETNTRFSIVKKNDQYEVASIVNRFGNSYKILFSRWEKGVLQFKYLVPSTNYYLLYTTREIWGNRLSVRWSNHRSTDTSTLIRE